LKFRGKTVAEKSRQPIQLRRRRRRREEEEMV